MRWPRCREVSRAFAEGAYDEAGAAERWLARLHLLACAGCRRFVRELELLGRAARLRAARLEAPPAGLAARVLARLAR